MIKYDEAKGLATLDITMMLAEDKGEYTCIAKSKAGQCYLTAPLLPAGKTLDLSLRCEMPLEKAFERVCRRGLVHIYMFSVCYLLRLTHLILGQR